MVDKLQQVMGWMTTEHGSKHQRENRTHRLGLWEATGIGIGAIVGGGILVLAGTALATAGPAAIVAFALNGVIALLTALSFAEMASKFPESGGTYTFAKKVFSIETAFLIGWVIWFASIAAAALYALGFAHFLLLMVEHATSFHSIHLPMWLAPAVTERGLAIACTILITGLLVWKSTGGGNWINLVKVAVFGVLILGGFWAMAHHDVHDLQTRMRPFFPGGFSGVIQAMGFTFIALQGFDLIATVGGEVERPAVNVPRAMIMSLGIAMLVYLPLLLVVTTVGTHSGKSITEMARSDPGGVVAQAARNYLGPYGYWLVLVAAVLATYSALQANLFAAARVARAMACDRTLPSPLRWISTRRQTPYVAIIATGTIAVLLMAVLRNVSAAGAASSLIFLVSFALAHWMAILVRQRSVEQPPPFRTFWFPLVPIAGGLTCLSLAIFQSIAVPIAGVAASVWLVIGGILFLTLFARRARVHDAVATARNPELARLRGYLQQVLVPIANPRSVPPLVELANTLTPARSGRLVVLNVLVTGEDWDPDTDSKPFVSAEAVAHAAISMSVRSGIELETLLVAASEAVPEIAHVAERLSCDLLVIGLSRITPAASGTRAEQLLSTIPADVVVLRAPDEWRVDQAVRILVLVAGQGGHDTLRARILGSLVRTRQREVTYLRIVPEGTSADALRNVRREVTRLVADEMADEAQVVVQPASDPVAAATQFAQHADLVILGVARVGNTRLFGRFTRRLALRCDCPMVVINRR